MTRRSLRGDGGDAGPLETVILLPVILMVSALVVLFGRTTTADTDVEHAARSGARAAAAAQTMAGARQRAEAVVGASLSDSGLSCASQSVAVTGRMQPGGRVTVAVTCEASLADLTRYGAFPGSRTLTAMATEVIDVHRGAGHG
jgi:Flp pilus assembly protein TadG